MNKPIDPKALSQLHSKIAEYTKRVEREKQSRRGGLIEFVRYFWHVLEPNTEMIEGWPMYAICDHLEAVTFNEINRLLITVFPGAMKSLLTDVFWPAWEWGPMNLVSNRYVTFSYSASLTMRDNLRFRDLMMSQEYQDLWGSRFSFTKTGETKISNDKTGWKLASSIGGVGTGERGNRVILDDPHSIKEAESDTVRTETTRWFREAMLNRLNDMEEDAIVIILQRSHYDDVAGVILQEEFDYVHLSIEMEYDSAREVSGPNQIGWQDPRIREGELAWPERFPQHVVDRIRKEVAPYAWASQYCQSPVPRGGGIIQRLWWQLWDAKEARKYGLEWEGGKKEFPHFDLIIGSFDGAYGEKDDNAFSALTIWGIWQDKVKNRRVMLMYAWQKRVSLHGQPVTRLPGEAKVNWEQRQQDSWGVVEWIADTCKRYKVQRLLIEAKANGQDVAREIRRLYARENWGVELIDPKGDKVARAHSVVPLFTDGMVWAPETRWSDMVIDQVAKFPRTKFMDLTDTVTQVLTWLRQRGLAIRADEFSAALDDEMEYRKPEASVAEQYGV